MLSKKSISRSNISIALLIVFLLLSVLPVHPVFAATTFNVNSVLDAIDDDTSDGVCHTAANTCTLRAAIMQANKMTGPGVTINLPAGTYTLTRPPTGANGDDNGDLNLTTPVSGSPVITIAGAGAGTTIIDANQLDRVFYVHPNRTATISAITIQNGYGYSGGGIYNHGTLTVTNSTLSGNSGADAGGIYNSSALTITNSTLSSNSANYGGGIYNNFLGYVTISNSTLSGNSSAASGGGIQNYYGILTVTNSTISQNTAHDDGGGINNWGGTANIYNTSIVFNGADADVDFTGVGGGVFSDYSSGAIFNLRNSLVAGNKTRGLSRDCSGTLNSYGRNLFKNVIDCTVNTGSGSWTYIDSLDTIGPLQNNGGPTMTHALLPGSNAIDGGDPTLGCVDSTSYPLATDQRGMARVSGVRCDIGAFEYYPNQPPTNIALSNNSVTENQPVGTLVGNLTTTDPDPGNTHTYSFTCTVPGTGDTFFKIGGANGDELQTAASFNYEVHNTYTICLRADDGNGGTYDKPFTITVTNVNETLTATLRSVGANDGWILESAETSAAGGTLNAAAATFNLGDNAQDKQYRAILHFDTSSLPDNAVITRITLRIRKQGLAGTDPFTTHGKIVVDIRKGAFGNNNALQASDFQSTAHKNAAAIIQNTPVNNWYAVNFPANAFAFLNKAGVTQFRLRFQVDDNNDNGADVLRFFSGNVANANVRPTIVIEYYVP